MVFVEFDHSKAATVHGDAVAQLHRRGKFAGAGQAYAEAATVFAVFERFNFSDVLGDSCKHRENILELRNRGRRFLRICFSAAATLRTSSMECAPWGLRRCP